MKKVKTIIIPIVSALVILGVASKFELSKKIQIEASVIPNPVISRGLDAYSKAGNASAANNEQYWDGWSCQSPDYIAYDMSKVEVSKRNKVILAWYGNPYSPYTALNSSGNSIPTNYKIQVNKSSGGIYPTDDWVTLLDVKDNIYHSRQHLVDMKDYNWIRMYIEDANSSGININLDIHDCSNGVDDSWIFYGDSITQGGMVVAFDTFAQRINAMDNKYFPAAENGGIGGILSKDGKDNIDKWISIFPGKYCIVAYGTNDCWGNQTGTQKYYENTEYMINAIISAGKIPVVPTIPYSTNTGVQPNVKPYNDMIRKLYEEYPQIIKGPDFEAFFKENIVFLSSDGVHPSTEGYAEMRRLWAETMYKNVYTAEKTVLKYDIDGDGSITVKDVSLLIKNLLGKNELSNDEVKRADINEDGSLDIFDAILLKKELLKI